MSTNSVVTADGDSAPDASSNLIAADALSGQIVLGLGYGDRWSLVPEHDPSRAAAGVEPGLAADLLQVLLIEGALGSLRVLLDYDASRGDLPTAGPLAETDRYSLEYQAPSTHQVLREASIGNVRRSIPGTRLDPIDESSSDSFAARAVAEAGRVRVDALLRYGATVPARKVFRPGRSRFDVQLLDVDYVKRRFFLLPDADIDEPSLQVAQRRKGASGMLIEGRQFALLVRGVDYRFDNSRGRLFLTAALAAGDELAAFYRKDGNAVGNATLGRNAIIDPTGARADFDAGLNPEYFGSDGATQYLYLSRSGIDSYWELNNYYLLEGIVGALPRDLEVELLSSTNGASNENYLGLLEQLDIDSVRGAVSFELTDTFGFYPRPFPGEFPFTHPTTPGNPFAPTNPIYGGAGPPPPTATINTLRVRYEVATREQFLDVDVVAGSVRVFVDDVELAPRHYSVDYHSGVLTVDDRAVDPLAEIEVRYRRLASAFDEASLDAAVGISYGGDRGSVHSLTALRSPLGSDRAPRFGAEQGQSITTSADASFEVAPRRSYGPYLTVRGGGALAAVQPNPHGRARLADMQSSPVRAVSLRPESWILGSRSQLLPQPAGANRPLGNRGEVRFRNLWSESLLAPPTLQPVTWDDSVNPTFTYAEKAGPYASADRPTGSQYERSLVVDFSFVAGSTDPYVSIVTPMHAESIAALSELNLQVRGVDVNGGAVAIYAELLRSYDEDLDGDGSIDGERSALDTGFTIVPVDGGQTVVGSGRRGGSNGSVESEDLDDDGVLDTGPGSEDGAVLGTSGTAALVQLPVGSGEWQQVTLDLAQLRSELAVADPDVDVVFQQPAAIRLTVVPVATGVAPAMRGTVLIHRLWLSGTELTNDAPQYLHVAELEPDLDSATAFSSAFPAIYAALHGQKADPLTLRQERSLRVTVVPPVPGGIPTGTVATVSHRFGASEDLSAYERLHLYLYLPPAQVLPAEAQIVLALVASDGEQLQASLMPSALSAGWNQLSIELAPPYAVHVAAPDGAEQHLTDMTVTGVLRVERRVAAIVVGVEAATGAITQGFELWLDEWHLEGAQQAFDAAAYADVEGGFAGTLVAVGDWPIVSDLHAELRGRLDEHWLPDDGGRGSASVDGTISGDLTPFLSAEMSLGVGQWWPAVSEPLPPALAGQAAGAGDRLDYGLRLALAAADGDPLLEQRYRWRQRRDNELALTTASYQFRGSDTQRDSIELAATLPLPPGISAAYSLTRSWDLATVVTQRPADGFVPASTRTGEASERHAARLGIAGAVGRVSASAGTEHALSGTFAGPLPAPSTAYGRRLGQLLQPLSATLDDPRWLHAGQDVELSVDIPRQQYLGSSLSITGRHQESDFRAGGARRDVDVDGAWTARFHWKPIARGRVVITPELQRSVRGSYDRAASDVSTFGVVSPVLQVLFAAPLIYLDPRAGAGQLAALDAVSALVDEPGVEGVVRNELRYRTALQLRLLEAVLPLPTRIGVHAGGSASGEGAARAVIRNDGANVGFLVPLGQPRSESVEDLRNWLAAPGLDIGLSYEHIRDFATQSVRQVTTATTTVRPSALRQWSLTHVIVYQRQRQRIGDSTLLLYPGAPELQPVVPALVDNDTVDSRLQVTYTWRTEHAARRRSLINPDAAPVFAQHTEEVTVENDSSAQESPDRQIAEVPLRVTLYHRSTIALNDSLDITAAARLVYGIERQRGPAEVPSVVPAIAAEASLTATIRF